MTTFGQRLVNVLQNTVTGGTLMANDPAAAEGNTRALQTLASYLQPPAAPRNDVAAQGGVLYFPAGRYHLTKTSRAEWSSGYNEASAAARRSENPFAASIVILENVTVWFAPGAILVLQDGCCIDIQGTILAEPQQIFSVVSGYVILGSSLPWAEAMWWGVQESGVTPAANTLALQAAVDSCLLLRSVAYYAGPVRGTRTRSKVPLRLRGTVELSEGIVIDYRGEFVQFADAPPRRVVLFLNILRAQSDSLEPNTLRPGNLAGGLVVGMPGPTGVRPIHLRSSKTSGVLFHAIFTSALEIRDVGLECAGEGEMVTAHFELKPPPLGGGAAQLITLVNCTLKSRSRYCCVIGVVIRPGQTFVDGRTLSASSKDGGQDLAHFHCDRVVFDHTSTMANSTTLYFRSGNTIPLSLRDCHFQGSVAAFLKAYSGPLSSFGCTFDNGWQTVAPRQIGPLGWQNVLGYEDAQGEDVYLTGEYPDVVFDRLIPTRPVVQIGNIGLAGQVASFPGIQMVHGISRSGRLFGTSNASPFVENNVDIPSTLIHIRCVPRRPTTPQPTVFWGLNQGVEVIPNFSGRTMPRAIMSKFSPLIVVGLMTPAEPMVCHGASQSGWVALRSLTGAQIFASMFNPVSQQVVLAPTYIYGILPHA
ncbi:MAG: hypothetical protein JNK72_04390 [Myxococcales bacterium]|nr:hypothetical protein [Myxococcales bacterium]